MIKNKRQAFIVASNSTNSRLILADSFLTGATKVSNNSGAQPVILFEEYDTLVKRLLTLVFDINRHDHILWDGFKCVL